MAAIEFFIFAIIVDTAHILSPMVLTWTNARLRQEALARWRWFILAPAVAAAAALLASLAAFASGARHRWFHLQAAYPAGMMLRSAPWVVSLRIAVSVCHYLYDVFFGSVAAPQCKPF